MGQRLCQPGRMTLRLYSRRNNEHKYTEHGNISNCVSNEKVACICGKVFSGLKAKTENQTA